MDNLHPMPSPLENSLISNVQHVVHEGRLVRVLRDFWSLG